MYLKRDNLSLRGQEGRKLRGEVTLVIISTAWHSDRLLFPPKGYLYTLFHFLPTLCYSGKGAQSMAAERCCKAATYTKITQGVSGKAKRKPMANIRIHLK